MFAALLCLSALCPASLHAQAASSTSIVGVVTDSSGAVVVGASAKLTDKATNTPRTTVTNDAGRYFFANVVPGDYEIAVSKTGFRTTKTIVTASIGIPLTVDLRLELGSVSETVEVTATGAELQTLNATVGNTVLGDTLQSLPSIGRDTGSFVTLQPGVSPDGSVAGAVVDQSSFLLDGGQNTNDMDGSMQVYTPSFGDDPTGGIVKNQIGGAPTGVMPTPIDSVEEFKVNTANQTADFNSSAGAQVEVVTKRGTNAWHGTAYEYYLDNNFNANTWDNNASGTKLPSYHYNRAGGAFGGPIIPKKILGGKTYFFANFEGFWWPNSTTVERVVPTDTMRAGILTFGGVQYNLNTGTNCGPLGTAKCDPRGLGISPEVQQMWSKFMPEPNETGTAGGGCGGFAGSPKCDGVNEQGFKANMALPYTSYFGVARLDHDFGTKWHFNSSYRYYKLTRTTTSQVDIGGFFSGDTLGAPSALSHRPQQPWYYVAGLTTNITSNTTNDFHFSYLRNYWAWVSADAPEQFAGLGGALEPFGESATTVLAPYNVNTQNVRTRFWDGQDYYYRDDLTMLKGNHLFTFGGAYQHNFNWHQRSDNGGGINFTPVYQLGEAGSKGGGNVDFSSTLPTGVSPSKWARNSSAVLGIVTDSQIAYTRSGSNLALNPPLTHAFDQSTIPYYNVYFSDSWHMKPSFTLTYGLGWTLEMPPVEKNGKQIELVDAGAQQLDVEAYLHQREAAALNGQVYNPEVGFALVGNTGDGQKYPYDPYYGSFSPRIAAAWNPTYTDGFLGKAFGGNKTVVRGGYSRIYGRLNGVDLVLVPLLGTGLIQAVQCRLVLAAGTCGPARPTVGSAFRVGPTSGGWDGLVAPIPAASATLPQPTFPGVNDVSAAAGEALDPHFRPNVVDSFDLTIQRQLTPKILLELGYIGRRITHEYQPININAVPYMMTKGGQTFANAYANIEKGLGCATSFAACGTGNPASIAPQPFFETALAGTGYCNGFASCTAAVVSNEMGNLTTQSAWSLWSDLDHGGFNFPRSMLNTPLNCPTGSEIGCAGQLSSGVGVNASVGYGNYNGGFVSLKATNWHNLTLQQNFTYSKALGTGAFVQATSEYTPNDPFDIHNMYGVQNFDRKFVYNVYALIDEPYFKGQHGLLGHILGGWTLAPVFAAGSGAPVYCGTNTNGQSFGAGDASNFFDNEQCIFTGAHPYGASLHRDGNPGEFNIFAADPTALFNTIRNPILGLDSGTGGVGAIRGLPYWNMDVRVTKNVKISERASVEFQFVTTNLFNHPVFFDPFLDPTSFDGTSASTAASSFGSVSTQGNFPRQMQFGLRIKF
ncbi:MAG TPA: carboxypeptidase-like regulatory domain-containing protein [Candidatus Acidoferrum sp.]|nr:carboxypeptidase-like regulatory domain-containing protein [Candidatus Acidoferrum sp.]